MFDYEYKTPEVIMEMEAKYPEMTGEFKKICREQYEIFCQKQSNYGKGNIMLGGDVDSKEDNKMAMAGIAIRLADKSNRLLNLLVKNAQDRVGESAIDTLQDMSNYAIIGQIVNRLKWK
jgi:hypothetical protein